MALWPFRRKAGPETPPAAPPDGAAPPPPEPDAPADPSTPREPAAGPLAAFRRGLKKTAAGLSRLLGFSRRIDDALLDELEVTMFEADFGPEMVAALLEELRAQWRAGAIAEAPQIAPFLQNRLLERLTVRDTRLARAARGPTVILVAGVNGTGKTTSIAKLAYGLSAGGATVLLAAADTFRAAATEQLTIWSERIHIPIVTGKAKGDPAAVAYSACARAISECFDYIIVDTAGRLHTQAHLMRELEKVRRVIAGQIEGAPHETLLVLDATCGQNALSQADAFNRTVKLTGLIMAKLDGTAKGGIIVTLNNRLEIPVKFVGLGERVEDWAEFDAERFVRALFA